MTRLDPRPRVWLHRRSALGDVLMALPIAALLARRDPSRRPTLVTHPRLLPLLGRAPFADAVARATPTPGDQHVDLHRSWPIAALRGRRGLPRRGLLDPLRRGLGRPTRLDAVHAVTRYGVAAGLGRLPLPLPLTPGPLLTVPPDRGVEDEGTLRVGLVVGAAHPSKVPTPESLAQVVATLTQAHPGGLRVVWLGGAGDKIACHLVTQTAIWPPHLTKGADERALTRDALGLAASVAGCDLVVGGDTGPMHLAQALDVPSLTLFGPTSPQRWGPWRASATALATPIGCRPCSGHGQRACRYGHRACLTRIAPDHLRRATLNILREVADR